MGFLLLRIFPHAVFAAAAARDTELADFLLLGCGKGTVFKPFPFSKAKVSTEAHWLQSQKCSMRCGIEPSHRLHAPLEESLASISTRKSFPSLKRRKGFGQLGFAHFCNMAATCAFASPNGNAREGSTSF
jgi:hypothetical protein